MLKNLKALAEYWKVFAIAGLLYLILAQFIMVNISVPTESMESTVMTGDRIIASRLSYINSDPERFDIVVFKFPDDRDTLFIKRVIGLPGETVEIKAGKVYINGSTTPLDDSFCYEDPIYGDFGPFKVPNGKYFMMGDNRFNSYDSRYWDNKYVPRDDILAEACIRYFPRIGLVGKNR